MPLFAFLNKIGISPNINPIKASLVCIGKVLNKYFKILPNAKTPMKIPKDMGKRNKKCSLKFLNKFKTLFTSFSYIPKITHKTPLLMPGSMAPAPI